MASRQNVKKTERVAAARPLIRTMSSGKARSSRTIRAIRVRRTSFANSKTDMLDEVSVRLLIPGINNLTETSSNMSVLELAKLVRLTRMARMVRLLRALPELMVLIKGLAAATRSVFFTFCLLAIIVYVFA